MAFTRGQTGAAPGGLAVSARLLLRLLLVVQVAAALAIAVFASSAFGLSPWAALALGAAAVVLVRLAIFSNNFVMSARSASATPAEFRLGAAGWLRMFGEEFVASMLQTSWHIPRAAPRQVIHPGSAKPPVLLLHGYGCNSGYWDQLTPLLDRAGISHATFDLEPITCGIDDYVEPVQRAVEALCAATCAHKVVIVGHSMGGLVARAWLRQHGAARLARLITLGTPHLGTCLASFGVGRNAAQMRRDGAADGLESAWLRELAAGESAATRALITSIYTHHDNIVSPQTSSFLQGAHNIAIGGVGHVALGRNRRVLEQVMREIDALSAPDLPAQTLLIVDDDAFMLDILVDFLAGEGYTILTAQAPQAGLDLLEKNNVQVILCDQSMPHMNGTEFLERSRQLRPDCYRIMLTGQADLAPIEAAIARGLVDHHCSKPWNGAALRASLREGFRVQAARKAALEAAH
jgi:CheY-like chemotaxis protein/triacylglycerol esterase/lipase EstA (alpha/beta hydrolase family)